MWKSLIEILNKISCHHDWRIHSSTDIYENVHWRAKDSKPIETRQTLICNKCGKIEKITL